MVQNALSLTLLILDYPIFTLKNHHKPLFLISITISGLLQHDFSTFHMVYEERLESLMVMNGISILMEMEYNEIKSLRFLSKRGTKQIQNFNFALRKYKLYLHKV